VGTMQIVLAMIEQGRIDPGLALDDPLAALRRWSRDPMLGATARLVSGGEVTAIDLQRRFLEEARRFVEAGGCEGLVPRAAEILASWEDTLLRLRRRDWPALARRLDWVLKLSLLGRALETDREMTWRSPSIKHLDHLYSSLDPEEGLHWRLAADGLLDTVVPEEDIARATREPPPDTRAWGRAMLLRRAGPGVVDAVDWDCVAFRLGDPGRPSVRWRVDLPDPLRSNREELLPAFERAERLGDLLPALGASRETPFQAMPVDPMPLRPVPIPPEPHGACAACGSHERFETSPSPGTGGPAAAAPSARGTERSSNGSSYPGNGGRHGDEHPTA